jgi:8-oxo-dGTP pyrophosphatase MutT (NUDIX family)
VSEKEAKSKIPVLEQISAGGVAFRRVEGEYEVAIISMNPSGRWQLPKGLIDDGESPEQAAVREVREEAGVETELLEALETIDYWFVSDWDEVRRRIHKQVHFFLLRYTGGDVADHDDEVLESRWLAVDEAIGMLAFDSEKQVVEKAKQILESGRFSS